MNITFYSKKKHLTHNYYFQFPKPMLETKMLKILDTNPKLVKSIGRYLHLNPLTEYLLYKHWGRIGVIDNEKKLLLDRGWYEKEPQTSQEITDLMRSY